MPVLNEADHLRRAVAAVLEQDYPGEQEIILALGPSTDGSLDIAEELANSDDRVKLVHNPERDIPIGLNLAIDLASHPIIVRVDAHSELSAGYTTQAVNILRTTGAANVGGRMLARGHGIVQQAIAGGYNSPLGLGGGTYHFSDEPHQAESAYLGVFPKTTHTQVGGFDPTIRRGEDWEFNLRVRQAGGTVWFDPSLEVTYWPRSSLRALAQQFFATGSWRAALVRKYPRNHPWRFFVPGLFVLCICVTAVVGLLHLLGVIPATAWWPYVLYLAPLSHLVLTLYAGFHMPESKGPLGSLLGAWTVCIMHYAWGFGFLKGFFIGSRSTYDKSRAT